MDLTRPPGDDGLFGPSSAAWRVHGDFTAMMIGGISALLLQMLHPAALAGVWDHSGFRDDRHGRLKRTARFIAATTFGSTEQARTAIAQVRRIHDCIGGVMPDGTRYTANDPVLLTWVHVAEVDSFLRAYLRYRDQRMSAIDQDRYLAETATVAEALGATDVPRSRAAIDAYFASIRPDLRADHRTREVAQALLAPGDDRATTSAMNLAVAAAIDLLPPWAQALHGRSLPTYARSAVRLGANSMGSVLRWALKA
ncbi:oxygenase MpaB family protein [Sphingomonas sp. Mn802worker]|uniref:oxygenase MpaB family protein n=1 Tax=Sphingomonas sp. Mn802worker TaxID=629773 RepID=UPI0003722E88